MSEGLTVSGSVERGGFVLDVDLHVAPGTVLAVLGPNGAGKTTLLRLLAGLESLTSGQVTLAGRVLDDPAAGVLLAPEARPVGLVFQNYRLFPHLDVADNVAFAARCRGRRRRAARAGAQQWLDRLGIGELAARKPDALSGGQAQRVALARALAAEPDLLLLDEPLSALDARTRLDVRAELLAHLAGFAGPVVIVTHDPLEAMVLADRLLVLQGGRVAQEGTPAEVAARPVTSYVATLVGLNLYAGSLAGDGTTLRLDGGGELHVLAPGRAAGGVARVAGRALAAVRPSAVAVATARPGPASPRNVWPGEVAGMELLADRVRLDVRGTPGALVDLSPAAVAELELRPGTPVWLTVKASEVDVYPEPAAGAQPGAGTRLASPDEPVSLSDLIT